MRCALVTGGAGGIGAAVSRAFAERGDTVAVHYHRGRDRAEALAAELREQGRNVRAFGADLRDAEACRALVDEVCAWAGKIDVLVNNAGVSLIKLFWDCTEEDYEEIFDVNLRAAVRLIRLVSPGMCARGYGKIVNVSSVWGQTGASCEALYSASKAALIGLTQALGKELASSGVNVNCVAPGVIDTEMVRPLGEETLRQLAADTPANRLGRPEDVAACVLFLAEDASSFLVGQTLAPNGGFG